MSHVLLVQADARRIPLAEKSVHCCVTSPPYYGLRDYGTGTWQGGDAACDHTTARSRGDDIAPGDKQGTSKGSRPNTQFICPCGAVREDQQLGLEPTHDCAGAFTGTNCGTCYTCHIRQVAAEIWRVLRDDGTFWLNIGDSYANDGKWGGTTGGKHVTPLHGESIGRLKRKTSLKPKSLIGIPWRVALALQQDGWTLRSEIIWAKKNCMPESVSDRPTRAHEQVFLFSKRARYFFDAQALAEPLTDYGQRGTDSTYQHVPNGGDNAGLGALARRIRQARLDGNCTLTRNARSVWTIATTPTPDAHFATMAPELAKRCILAGTSGYGVCLACQAPYTRIVERQRLLDGQPFAAQAFSRPDEPYRPKTNGISHTRYSTQVTEHGWQPSCRCFYGPGYPLPTSAIVLDPFAGSGTTGVTAWGLGRSAVLCDLSMPYLRTIAKERLGFAAWMATATTTPMPPDDAWEQLSFA